MYHLYTLWLLPIRHSFILETSPFRICQEATDSRTTTKALGSRASQRNLRESWLKTIEITSSTDFSLAELPNIIFFLKELMAFVINFDALPNDEASTLLSGAETCYDLSFHRQTVGHWSPTAESTKSHDSPW